MLPKGEMTGKNIYRTCSTWRGRSHKFGFYHSGPHAGQILVVVTYPDMATHERAMESMSKDADWKRVAGEIEKIAPLQENYLIDIIEEQ